MDTSGIDKSIPFKAETQQLLSILIHSLYKDREIFLRELISNASDALTRFEFEMLTNRDVLEPDSALEIRILVDKDAGILTIEDSGIGMTENELVDNLGTIAHSGARAFVEAAQRNDVDLTRVIGQFGVGFYSAFMVAEWIKVVSRSYRTSEQAAEWFCDGSTTFSVRPSEREHRGTSVILKLKDDAKDFLEESRLKQIIRQHSDFVSYPIYIGGQEEQANRQTAIWRQQPTELKDEEYNAFFQQLTNDFGKPLTHTHLIVDAPVQMYAVLFVPSTPERTIFSSRKDDGLKLYARKILIQDYCKDLLPEYLAFIQGVVDSEDLPLNVSRETIQATKLMATLKKLITSKSVAMLAQLSEKQPELYSEFWEKFGRYIKQGVAVEQEEVEKLYPLLRFKTTAEQETWSSLEDYIARMQDDQEKIYYILGDDDHSVMYSPHLDMVRAHDYEVLLLTDPIDPFMLVRLKKYKDIELLNVAKSDLAPPETEENKDENDTEQPDAAPELLVQFKETLGDRVENVRYTERLSGSPARLVDPEGALDQEMQRVYRLVEREYQAPKKILELNPKHDIIRGLEKMDEGSGLTRLIIEQIYENALLLEGLHPEPASMVHRIQEIISAALG